MDAPTISTRGAIVHKDDGTADAVVLILDADGSIIRALDARRIDSFLASVRASADVAVAAVDQHDAASPLDRKLLSAQPEGRA